MRQPSVVNPNAATQTRQLHTGNKVSVRRLRLLWPFGLIAVMVATSGCREASATPAATPFVTEVVDGDTVAIAFPSGAVETVRLLGIDTPETVDPTRPVQCFGREASRHLESLLPTGTPVRLERDLEPRDHFGRLLAYVFRVPDDVFVNLDLVARGMADVSFYEPNTTYRAEFAHALTTARTQQLGLWGTCGGPDVALDPDP